MPVNAAIHKYLVAKQSKCGASQDKLGLPPVLKTFSIVHGRESIHKEQMDQNGVSYPRNHDPVHDLVVVVIPELAQEGAKQLGVVDLFIAGFLENADEVDKVFIVALKPVEVNHPHFDLCCWQILFPSSEPVFI